MPGMAAGPDPPKLPSERPGPPGGKRDRNRRRRTQALLEAALAQFLREGVENVSVEAIARAAGLAKGSFYRYFTDKRELVESLLGPVRERLEGAFADCRQALAGGGDPLSVFLAYQALGQVLAEVVAAQPDVARLYLQESRAPAVGARAPIAELARAIAAEAIELTRHAQARGLLRQVDPTVSALTVVGAAERLLQAHLAGEWTGDGERLVAELVGIALEGLRPEEQREQGM